MIKSKLKSNSYVQHADRRRVKHTLEAIEYPYQHIFEKKRYHKPLSKEEKMILYRLENLR